MEDQSKLNLFALEMELSKIRKTTEKSIIRKYELEFNPIEPKFCSWGFDLSSSYTNEFYMWMHQASKEEKKNIYDVYRAEILYINQVRKESIEMLQQAVRDESCILRYRYSLLTKIKQLSADLGIDHRDAEIDGEECVKMPRMREVTQGPFNDRATQILLNLNRNIRIKMNINSYREKLTEIIINPTFKYNAIGEEIISEIPEKHCKIDKIEKPLGPYLTYLDKETFAVVEVKRAVNFAIFTPPEVDFLKIQIDTFVLENHYHGHRFNKNRIQLGDVFCREFIMNVDVKNRKLLIRNNGNSANISFEIFEE
ncbi:hypothetical protein V9T40_005870 [Parthenolecanium corni]|uniref:Uncharacterized protein n=1 Tax=Parthenolecanium corni TaxID=536013 RepID=A0AAN9YAV5_9HEMI